MEVEVQVVGGASVEMVSKWCGGGGGVQVHTPELGLPPLDAPVPDSWTTIEDDFVLIYAVHQVRGAGWPGVAGWPGGCGHMAM